ncbi:hypothetical protein MMC24_007882 [Lignoscripta atroalba]|nr:hypothetical protein [Lignoscripta atroalba]
MSKDLQIDCPQPVKPLKRKISQLHLFSEADHSKTKRSKQELFLPTPKVDIENWLASSLDRSQNRSDSYLLLRKAEGFRGKSSRSDSFMSALERPVEPLFQMASYSPNHPLTPLSDTISTALQKDRVKSPQYRKECLERHHVYIAPLGSGRDMPTPLSTFVQNTVRKPRTSPPLSEEKIRSMQTQIGSTRDREESASRSQLKNVLLPSPDAYGGRLVGQEEAILKTDGLPYERFVSQPISQPKPDYSYGYDSSVFTNPQHYVQQSSALSPYAKPNGAYYWPFFHIEFKAQSRGGTHWVAENQNAGSGSLSVKSTETLLRYARDNPAQHRDVTSSVAFSSCIDSVYGTLWIHWLNDDDDDDNRSTQRSHPSYISSQIGAYFFQDATHLRDFHTHAKNILDYGLDKRLSGVKEAVNTLLRMDSAWTEKADRAAAKAMKRPSSAASFASETESFPKRR